MGVSFVPLNRRENRHSLVIFDRKEIAHLEALKITILRQSSRNRCCHSRESRNFGALSLTTTLSLGYTDGCLKWDPLVKMAFKPGNGILWAHFF